MGPDEIQLGVSLCPWSAAIVSEKKYGEPIALARLAHETDEVFLSRLICSFVKEREISGSLKIKLKLVIDNGALGFEVRGGIFKFVKKLFRSTGIKYGRVLDLLRSDLNTTQVTVSDLEVKLIGPLDSLATNSKSFISNTDSGVLMLFEKANHPMMLWMAERNMHFVWSQGPESNLRDWLASVASFCGFDGPRGWQKFYSLADLGEARFLAEMRSFIDEKFEDGRFSLDRNLIDQAFSGKPDWRIWEQIFRSPCRVSDSPITSREIDMACSMRLVIKDLLNDSAHAIRQNLGSSHIAIVGDSSVLPIFNEAFRESNAFTGLEMGQEDHPVAMARGALALG